MNVSDMADYLGISLSNAYALTRRPDFTAALRIGQKRIIISVEALREWLRREAIKPIV